MSRDYGQLRRGLWSDAKIKHLNDAQFRAFAYLIAGPHTTAIGCFYCPVGYLAADLGWGLDKAAETVAELSANGFVTVDDGGFVLVKRFLKHNKAANPNTGKHIAELWSEIPEDMPLRPALARALDAYGQHLPGGFLESLEPLLNRCATVPEPLRNIELEQELEQEQEQEPYAPSPADSTPAFVVLPLVGKDAKDGARITEAQADEWQALFPGVDVRAALLRMLAWCKAKPERRKTRKGVEAFVVSWLGRDQDSGRGPKRGGAHPPNGAGPNDASPNAGAAAEFAAHG